MFPRADMTGARPVAAIEAAKPTASIADARQDVLQRLTQIAVGRMMQAQVLSRMNDGSFMVKLADTAIRMNLPGSAQVGDTLELTLVTAHPRPTFSLGTPARESDTSLSSAARLIDSALRTAQKEGAPAALVGKVPLVHSPTATPAQLATALKDMLTFSGLFYESHVQQWASGERPLTELMREPQAKNSNESLIATALLRLSTRGGAESTASNLVQSAGNTPDAGGADVAPHAANAHGPAEGEPASAQAGHALPPPGTSLSVDTPAAAQSATPEAPANEAANDAMQSNNLPRNPSMEPAPAEKANVALPATNSSATDSSVPTKPGSDGPAADANVQVRADAMDSESARMISLQLDTLEQRRVAWQGELWPGQSMEWEVTEDAPNGSASDAERSWQSVVRFELPNLGCISAAIRLTGQRLQVQVRTADEGTASLLRTRGGELASALDAAGSPLDLFTVKRDESV